jgi:hypothetical protein
MERKKRKKGTQRRETNWKREKVDWTLGPCAKHANRHTLCSQPSSTFRQLAMRIRCLLGTASNNEIEMLFIAGIPG